MERLVFGMGPIGLAEARQRHRRSFATRLSEALDTEVVVVVASTYDELSGLVARGETHLAWLPPAVFVRSFDKGEVRLILSAVRAHGSRFRGVLFVRAEAPWHCVEDLRGLRVAWVDRGSCSGYLFPRLALFDADVDPDTYFDEQFLLGSHNAVARAVEVGKADVGATFVDQTMRFGKGRSTDWQHPGWALEVEPDSMRAILVSEPIPADTITSTPAIDATMRERIGQAMSAMHEHPGCAETLLGLFGVDRFELAEPAAYEPVRRALATTRARQ